MSHIEPEDLATLALDGMDTDAAARAHLDDCTECRAEYDAIVRTIDLARGEVDQPLEVPPPHVWTTIHRELGLTAELAQDPLGAPGGVQARIAEPGSPAGGPEAVDDPAAGAAAAGRATSAEARARRRWWPVALAAASAGVLVGLALGIALAGFGTGGQGSQTVVASATLAAFPGWSTSGTAVVEEDDDGARSIVVDLDEEVPASEVREVWLIRSDASGLVSLGLLEGLTGRFAVPAGIDLDEFTLVDVSAEPVDGDPSHSGDSIVRGELQRA
ncbi:anti-sigma factor [Agromyces silvae]|uniref:anti-sigma factor n=1 Tax=Agromyces silvae TaxID=3388266 RepID=UPI00280AA82D|nr:anti-sigma factor [Agromyces protaetiae]